MGPERIQPRVFTTAEPLEASRVQAPGTGHELSASLSEASVLPPTAQLQAIASELGTDGSSAFTGIGTVGKGEVTTHLSPAEFKAFLADGGVLRPSHGPVVASLDASADTSSPFMVEYNLSPEVSYEAAGDHFLLDRSVRDGRHMSVTYAGPNPAAPELPVDWLQGVHEPSAKPEPEAQPTAADHVPTLSATARAIRAGMSSREARKVPPELWPEVRRKLEGLMSAHDFRELGQLGAGAGGNNLEKLKGKLAGFWSIRVNKQYRIIFRVDHGKPTDVDVLDYHA